ncbi:MAG TPA: hypothetical protein VNT51_05560 [Miltoncostaeaceae bacterium]|nr:hypothetical protein [Miltoncostaeaceae bacterium]
MSGSPEPGGSPEAGFDPTPEEASRAREARADAQRRAGAHDIGGRDTEHPEDAPPRATTAFGGGPAAAS